MIKEHEDPKDTDRSFSPFYEKAIPIAIITIVVIIAVLLILTFGIALGLIQTG